MTDLHITIPNITSEEFRAVLATADHFMEVCTYLSFESESHWSEMHILVKLPKVAGSDDLYRVERALKHIAEERRAPEEKSRGKYVFARDLYKVVSLCQEHGCFELTANASLPKDQRVLVFNRHGEDPHPFVLSCWKHMGVSLKVVRHMLSTMEAKTLEEGVYWHKIFSWQTRSGKYYAQYVWNGREGDYEYGYYDYTVAIPWQGPFKTREAAIEAAEAYER